MIDDRFSKTLVYDTEVGTSELLADLRRIAELDKVHEARERFWKTVTTLAIVIGLASGWAAIMLSTMIFWVVPFIFLILAVWAGVRKAGHARLNLEDRRYQIVAGVVRHLSCDMPPETPWRVRVDFNDYQQREYLKERTGGSFSSVSSAKYAIPWLRLDGTLVDGNKFRVTAVMTVKRKEKHKRKYTRVKEVFREQVTLNLRIKEQRYVGLERLGELIKGGPVPSQAAISSVSREGNRVTVTAETRPHVRLKGRRGTTGARVQENLADQHVILHLFLACYHALGQCSSVKRGA